MKVARKPSGKRPVPGIRLKINLLLLAIQVPALVILAFETTRGIRETFREMGRSQAMQLAQELNKRLADPANQGRYQEALDEFLESTTGVEFNAAVFVAEGGELKRQASTRMDPLPEADENDLNAFERRAVFRTIESPEYRAEVVHRAFRGAEGSVIGVIRLGLDQTQNALKVEHSNRQLFVGMVVVFALGVGVLFVGMHLLVVYPVRTLAKAMGRAREGKLEVVSVGSSQDEIGWLGRSYNEMVQRLRALLDDKEKLLAEVRDLNIHLQDKIDEAVYDLAKSHRDLQKAYQDLFTSQRELQRLERLASLGQVAREIAHEFSTPLNVIYGTLQMLLEDPDLKEEHRERLGRLLNQTERLVQISRDTLTPLKMPPPEFRSAKLNGLVEEVGAFMAPAFGARGVEFSTQLEPDLPPIRADLHQIEQVLLNLISNAMDALPGGGRIEVETAMDRSESPPIVILHVRDDGVGISPEHLSHIFDPFFTTKGAGRGTGLGLSICKDIVSQHQGEISIESVPGEGSTITLRLPAALQSDESDESAEEAAA